MACLALRAFIIAIVSSSTCAQAAESQTDFKKMVAGRQNRRLIKNFSPELQFALEATGLKVIPTKECVVFLYKPENITPQTYNIDGHSLYSSFSIKNVMAARLWDRYRDPSQSLLTYQYATTDLYGEAKSLPFNKGQVDANKAYNIWISPSRIYPSSVAHLTQAFREVPYKRFEKKFEIQSFVLTPSPSEYSDILHACLGQLAGAKKECYCVGTSE